MKEKEIIELLKSGNFTIAYHDNGVCSLYKDKYTNYDKIYDEKPVLEIDCEFDGYLPKEVELLIKALGGKGLST